MLNWSSYSVLLSTRCIHCSFSSAFLLAFFVCLFSFHLSLFFAVDFLGPKFNLSRIIEFYYWIYMYIAATWPQYAISQLGAAAQLALRISVKLKHWSTCMLKLLTVLQLGFCTSIVSFCFYPIQLNWTLNWTANEESLWRVGRFSFKAALWFPLGFCLCEVSETNVMLSFDLLAIFTIKWIDYILLAFLSCFLVFFFIG